MSLQNLLDLSSSRNTLKQGISEERLRACMPELRNAIAFYRKYPDIFIDDIKGPDCIFKFYTYQRVFLRIVMRHKWVYAVFPRRVCARGIWKHISKDLSNCWKLLIKY